MYKIFIRCVNGQKKRADLEEKLFHEVIQWGKNLESGFLRAVTSKKLPILD